MPVEHNHRLTALDRIAHGIVSVGESRRARIILAAKPFVYADFVRRGVEEGMPLIGAALHPFLIRLGGIDQIFTNPTSSNQLFFTAELAELNTVGIATTLAVGASALSKYSGILEGELPIHDSDGVVFLVAGSSLPLAGSFGEKLASEAQEQH